MNRLALLCDSEVGVNLQPCAAEGGLRLLPAHPRAAEARRDLRIHGRLRELRRPERLKLAEVPTDGAVRSGSLGGRGGVCSSGHGSGASEASRRTVESVFSMIHMLDVIELAVSSTCTRGGVEYILFAGRNRRSRCMCGLACFDNHGTDERSGEMALPSLERLTTCRHGRRSKRYTTTPRSIAHALHANTHE